MKYITIAILSIVCAFALHQYISTNTKLNKSETKLKDIEGRLSDTLKDYAKYRSWSDSALNNATATAVQNGEIAEQSKNELDLKRGQITYLLTLLDKAEKRTPDSTWVRVSPDYKWGCDSLRRANLSLNTLVMQYEQDNQAHVNSLNYETYIRDSALEKERTFNASFRALLTDCLTTAKEQARINGPKTQLYAGMAAWGNTITPLGGGEINLGLKTKSNQFYELKGAYLNGWWVGVGTKFLINFK